MLQANILLFVRWMLRKVSVQMHALVKRLSHPGLFFYSLLWFMVILIVGTLSQKTMGLFYAQTTYFSAWFFWVDLGICVLPFPGGSSVLALITIGLLLKLFFKTSWKPRHMGVFITHLGAVCLLLSVVLSAYFSTEGSLDMTVGESRHHFISYHEREFLVVKNNDRALSIPFSAVAMGQKVTAPGLPFKMQVLEKYDHGVIMKREPDTQNPQHAGVARKMMLVSAPSKLEDEANQNAIMLQVIPSFVEKDVGNDAALPPTSTAVSKICDEDSISLPRIYLLSEALPQPATYHAHRDIFEMWVMRRHIPLPFQVTLLGFKKTDYPGTDMPQAFASHVRITDGGLSWEAHITMNEPLRYKGYTFYQSSYVMGEAAVDAADTSVLAVVQGREGLLIYLFCAMMGVGILLHLYQQFALPFSRRYQGFSSRFFDNGFFKKGLFEIALFKRGRQICCITALSLVVSGNAFAGAVAVAAPVPISSSAPLSWDVFSALPVLHEGRLKPLDSFARYHLKLFSGKETIADLSAIAWLAELMFQEEHTLERPIFQVQNVDVQRMLGLKTQARYSFQTLFNALGAVLPLLLSLYEKPQDKLTVAEAHIREIHTHMRLYADLLGNQTLLRMDAPKEGGLWQVPSFQSGPFQAMRTAYLARSPDAWARAVDHIQVAGASQSSLFLLRLEVLFHQLDPFFWSLAGCLFSLLCLIATVMIPQGHFLKLKTLCEQGAVVVLSSSVILQISGIVMRMLIMQRPPVTTLYESILFVNLFLMISSLWYRQRFQDSAGLFVGGISGILLGIMSLNYAQGDTLRVLVAVLNTNFWLTIHVVSITIGYGLLLIMGGTAHVLLGRLALGDSYRQTSSVAALGRQLMPLCLMALLFTSMGTVFGGIWADQSWGRFWGWDPKENGALLMVVWILGLLHGRLSGQLSPLIFMAGASLSTVIVALSWFGVNLLNVGLHSYGFTGGGHTALNLGLFCVGELLFVWFCVRRTLRRSLRRSDDGQCEDL